MLALATIKKHVLISDGWFPTRIRDLANTVYDFRFV